MRYGFFRNGLRVTMNVDDIDCIYLDGRGDTKVWVKNREEPFSYEGRTIFDGLNEYIQKKEAELAGVTGKAEDRFSQI